MKYLINDFEPFIKGKFVPPNLRPAPIGSLLSGSIHQTTHLGRLRREDHTTLNARFFLRITQGGMYTGTGWVLYSRFHQGREIIDCSSFALCDHRPVLGPRANPSRGYYPQKCELCGLDMTVDSGD